MKTETEATQEDPTLKGLLQQTINLLEAYHHPAAEPARYPCLERMDSPWSIALTDHCGCLSGSHASIRVTPEGFQICTNFWPLHHNTPHANNDLDALLVQLLGAIVSGEPYPHFDVVDYIDNHLRLLIRTADCPITESAAHFILEVRHDPLAASIVRDRFGDCKFQSNPGALALAEEVLRFCLYPSRIDSNPTAVSSGMGEAAAPPSSGFPSQISEKPDRSTEG